MLNSIILNLVSSGFGLCLSILFLIIYIVTKDFDSQHRGYLPFALFCFSLSIFVFTQAMIYSSKVFSEGLFWHRMQHVGAVWIPSSYLHFLFELVEKKRKRTTAALYCLSIIFFSVTFSDYFIMNKPHPDLSYGFEGMPGPFYYPFILFIIIPLFYGLFILGSKIKIAKEEAIKKKLKLVLTGLGFIIVTGLWDLLIMLKIAPAITLADHGLILLCSIIAYAIGNDVEYFKEFAELQKKKILFDRLDTTKHVVRLFLHDIRHIVAAFGLYLYHFKNGKLINPEAQYDRLMDRFQRCEDFLKDVLSPEFTDYFFEETYVIQYINKVIDNFVSIQTKKIKIVKKFPEKNIKISLDREKFEKVIHVILNNALDASNDEGEVRISVNRIKKMIRIKIEDNGTGMTEEQIEGIGRPRFSTKGERGEGLGLFTSMSVIQHHKGSMKIESKKGEGSSFIIELPLDKRVEREYTEELPVSDESAFSYTL